MVFVLLAGPERQGLGELNRDFLHKGIAVIYPADKAAADVVFHIERIVLPVARHAESCGYVLTFVRTSVQIAGKSRSAARKVNQLPL